jgi:glycosyltransferase involved in cell wall biosynthesis
LEFGLKIINIITDVNIGGAGMVLINYFRTANLTEFEHCVVLPKDSLLKPRLDALNVRIIEMDGIAAQSFSASAIGKFTRLFKAERPDIAHTHGCLTARVAARLRGGIRIVFTRHCVGINAMRGGRAAGVLHNMFSDKIIAISHPARDELLAVGTKESKIVTMYNGVPPVRELSDEEKSEVKAEYGIADGDFVCSVIARLEEVKGHKYILEAARLLEGYPIKFIIAGTGSIEKELKADASANCVFTGFVEDVARVLAVSDIQLNASVGTETSSLSLLEGFSAGVPAIASDFGGNPHLIRDGKNGLIVPVRDGNAIANAVLSLYNDRPRLKSMGENAKAIYRAEYTSEVMAENINSVYKSMMERKSKK